MRGEEQARAHYAEGLRLQKNGALRDALLALSRATAADPGFAPAGFELGRTHALLGQPAEAIAAFEAALRADPNHAGAAFHLARAYEQIGQPSRAIDAYERTVTLDADNFAAATALGRLLVEAGRALEALPVWDRALERWPDEKIITEGRAATQLALGRPGAALELMGGAEIEGVPGRGQRVLASIYTALGRWPEAIACWDRLIADNPSPAAYAGREEAEAGQRAARVQADDQPIPSGARAQAEIAWGRARSYAADARWVDAAEACDAVLVHEPSWREVAVLRADALERAGSHDKALSAWLELAHASPERVDAWARVGALHLTLGAPFDALEAFNRALGEQPDSVDAHIGMAEALRATGRATEALSWYERALSRRPNAPTALRGHAHALASHGRWHEARAAWLRVLALDPTDPEAPTGISQAEEAIASDATPSAPALAAATQETVARGRAAMARGHVADALAAFERAVVDAPDAAGVHFDLAEAALADGQAARALQAFDTVLRLSPTHTDAARRKGDVLRASDEPLLALAAYDAALAIRADDADSLFGRAETWFSLGRMEQAILDYTATLNARPHAVAAIAGMARALQTLGRYAEAASAWERLLTVAPGNAEARAGVSANKHRAAPPSLSAPRAPDDVRQRARDEVDRGRSYYRDRDIPNAIASFEQALVIDPSNAEAAFRLGLALEDDRQYRKAIEAYERCLSIDPTHAHAATNIGEAQRKNERYRDAIKAYDRALTISKNWLYALAGRAESMRMLGDYEASLKWFDRALEVGPNHVFAIQGKAASLNALRRFRDALPLWDRALAIDPRSQFALDGKAYAEAQLKTDDDGETSTDEASDTPTLDEQGRDLTALARNGRLGQVVGRDVEIRALMRTLVRRQKANPILLGDPGVGKTAVVEGLAARIAAGDVPAKLADLRVIELSMGSLLAGTKYRGTFEERMKGIVKEATAHPHIILFIDEIHTLVGAGRTEGGSLDAANLLKPALARGEVRVIGATTLTEYRKHFESDAALERRFQPITIEEPTAAQAVALLTAVAPQYEDHHDVEVAPSTVQACVELAVRYLPDRRLPDKALDLLDEACADASLAGHDHVDVETVARVVAERTGIAVGTLTEGERERLGRLDAVLAERVVAQDQAVHTLVAAVRRARTGLTDPKRPRGVFLFVGGSGVGKTELARALADTLFPDGPALVRIDMSEFGDRFTGTRLVGAPPGYVGHGEEGQLTGKLRRRPYAVVLLDEIEKAHPDVQAMFLSLFDEGTIEDSEGRRVQAREAIFVATTNAGTEIGARGRAGFSPGTATEVRMERLKPYFRPELLNRFDAVVFFEPLDAAALRQIARAHLERLRDRVIAKGIHLRWSEAVVERVAEHGADPKHGARPVLRAIRTLVEEPLGDLVIAEGTGQAMSWYIDVADGAIRFERDATTQDAQPAPAVSDPATG